MLFKYNHFVRPKSFATIFKENHGMEELDCTTDFASIITQYNQRKIHFTDEFLFDPNYTFDKLRFT